LTFYLYNQGLREGGFSRYIDLGPDFFMVDFNVFILSKIIIAPFKHILPSDVFCYAIIIFSKTGAGGSPYCLSINLSEWQSGAHNTNSCEPLVVQYNDQECLGYIRSATVIWKSKMHLLISFQGWPMKEFPLISNGVLKVYIT
jgi:hypothetical protein